MGELIHTSHVRIEKDKGPAQTGLYRKFPRAGALRSARRHQEILRSRTGGRSPLDD